MESFTFTSLLNPQLDKKIEAGLHKECKALTGIVEDFKNHSFYAHVGDTFAGGIHLAQHGDILWIDSIWVEPSFRKQGLGKQLIDKAHQISLENKAKEFQLNTFFPEAHTFFLKCGFEDITHVPNWKYGLDCYMMRKRVEYK